ncbi:PDZ domain-containing protein [Streptomyces sp. NPDC002580]|uniref:PDZ domain-containing protein n=1 Tax=Streptomyces sp. NPDC002580 TaxID=3364653 RepID=UPI0036C236F0
MEQTALRPKPMPGQDPGGGARLSDGARTSNGVHTADGARTTDASCPPDGVRPPGGTRRPHAARRRGGRLVTLLFTLFTGAVLILSGVGLGTVGATVIGMSRLADLKKQAGAAAQARQPSGGAGTSLSGAAGMSRPGGSRTAVGGGPLPSGEPSRESGRATLGIEAVDAPGGGGALVVGVHVPGPAHTAGLVRGDVLLSFGGTPVASAADLARAVAAARPGGTVALGVRHADGTRGQLSAAPGIVT